MPMLQHDEAPQPGESGPLLTRKQAADCLTMNGFPTRAATLATLISRGDGPRYRKWGARVLYAEADLLTWARSRLRPVARNSSEQPPRQPATRRHRSMANVAPVTAPAENVAANAQTEPRQSGVVHITGYPEPRQSGVVHITANAQPAPRQPRVRLRPAASTGTTGTAAT
jgi:hypothetical protein